MTELVTVGHGRLDGSALTELLRGAEVAAVVDVRRFPGSRNNPDVARTELEQSLPDAGIGYRWDERLGGRRRLPKCESPDPWWTVDAFRAYAAHTRTPEFRAGLGDLLTEAGERHVAVMCSESVWWRCHRRVIADVVEVGHGIGVRHLMHDARLHPHRPAAGARVADDGLVVWDVTD